MPQVLEKSLLGKLWCRVRYGHPTIFREGVVWYCERCGAEVGIWHGLRGGVIPRWVVKRGIITKGED